MPSREGRDREPSELALARVGDLARLVQVHQAGREHLGVDAVVATVFGRQQDDVEGIPPIPVCSVDRRR